MRGLEGNTLAVALPQLHSPAAACRAPVPWAPAELCMGGTVNWACAPPPCTQLDAARDLGNYGLCARSRVQLGRRLTLNAVVEAPDTNALVQRLSELRQAHAAAQAGVDDAASAAAEPGPSAAAASLAAAGPAGSGAARRSAGPRRLGHAADPPELEPCMAHATLRCALPGHDLTATAGYNLQYVDSAGDVSHVPLAVSLDLASHDRQDGLQYRVGLHQVGGLGWGEGSACRAAGRAMARACGVRGGWAQGCAMPAHAAPLRATAAKLGVNCCAHPRAGDRTADRGAGAGGAPPALAHQPARPGRAGCGGGGAHLAGRQQG